ncbi:MAG: metal-sensitive transcriptional regulator [Propionicimonas sp.]
MHQSATDLESAPDSAPLVGAEPLHLNPDELGSVVKRLKRAQGQLGGIVRMIEEGRDCADIVTQMAAVSKALDRAGFAVIAAGLKQCLTEDPTGDRVDTSSLEKLFLSLA